jgi:hypothetical protein
MAAVMATTAADQPTVDLIQLTRPPNVGLFTEFRLSKNKLSLLTGFIDGPLVTTFKLRVATSFNVQPGRFVYSEVVK